MKGSFIRINNASPNLLTFDWVEIQKVRDYNFQELIINEHLY